MFHFAALLFAGCLYIYASAGQLFDATTKSKIKMNQSRAGTADLHPGGGFRDTENNLAYFNTSIPRHRQNGLSLYEAEAIGNKHEVHDEIVRARKEGNALRQVEILARWNRQKDQALKNVAKDYDKPYSMLNLRRNDPVTSTKRIMETIADNPKLNGVSAWVPHYRAVPLPESMTRSYWRPNAYTTPGYTHV